MSQFTIKVLLEGDWCEYKSIRLKSLQDSPDSFGSTYDREAGFTPEQWKSRLNASSTCNTSLTLAASSNQNYIGLVSGVIHSVDANSAHLYQMWVDPNCRGMGVGTALIERIRTWAEARNVSKLLLSVTTSNLAAASLYQSIGFTPVGILEPLRPGSSLQSQPMQLKLDTGNR